MNEKCEKLIKISDFDSICRLCLENDPTIQPILLKTEDDDTDLCINNNIVKIIYAFTSIQIYPNDGMPRFLCEQCIEKLNSSYEFLQRCLYSDKILQSVRDAHDADMLKTINISNEFKNKLEVNDNVSDDKNTVNKLKQRNEKELEIQVHNVIKKEFNDVETDGENASLAYLRKKSKKRKNNSIIDAEIIVNQSMINRNLVVIENSSDEFCDKPSENNQLSDDGSDATNDKSENMEKPKCKSKEKLKIQNRRLTKEERLKTRKVCPVCGVLTYALSQHIMIHGEKNHKCEICGKAFAQRGTHKTHMYTHTGDKPYKCSLCDKKFCDSSSRKSHMVSHTGEKNYHCEICRKSFGYSHSLAAHRRTHTQDRKHACNYCGRLFLNNFQLKYHIRIHTGEKPYHCQYCTKSFITSGHLAKHKHVHTRERIKCTMCEMDFTNRRGVNSHLKKDHGVIITKKNAIPETSS